MPKRVQVTDTIFARKVSHLAPTINEIAEKHRIAPADFTRGLLEAACSFYQAHGWFSFPVVIAPQEFQLSLHAAEAAAPYFTKKAEAVTKDGDLKKVITQELRRGLRAGARRRKSQGGSGAIVSPPIPPK